MLNKTLAIIAIAFSTLAMAPANAETIIERNIASNILEHGSSKAIPKIHAWTLGCGGHCAMPIDEKGRYLNKELKHTPGYDAARKRAHRALITQTKHSFFRITGRTWATWIAKRLALIAGANSIPFAGTAIAIGGTAWTAWELKEFWDEFSEQEKIIITAMAQKKLAEMGLFPSYLITDDIAIDMTGYSLGQLSELSKTQPKAYIDILKKLPEGGIRDGIHELTMGY